MEVGSSVSQYMVASTGDIGLSSPLFPPWQGGTAMESREGVRVPRVGKLGSEEEGRGWSPRTHQHSHCWEGTSFQTCCMSACLAISQGMKVL